MKGTKILTDALSTVAQRPDKYGNRWQYHPNSDRHSKFACWGLGFDLLATSSLLREHVADGKVAFGVHHQMNDFRTGRRKNLDLVIGRPADESGGEDFADLAEKWDIPLDAETKTALGELPIPRIASIGAVLVAVEAKACMTEHVKALPRLYDELNSSHLTVHGASNQAIAVGYVMVNAATSFVSPKRNQHLLGSEPTEITELKQPHYANRAIDKVKEIPRRPGPGQEGFDAMGIVVVEMENDGSPVKLVSEPPAPAPDEIFYYDQMVNRVAHSYEVAFAGM